MRFVVVLALLVSDEQGNAKALTSGTSDRIGSTFSFVYILTFCKTSQHGSHWQKNICNMAISSIEHRSGWYDIFDARGKKAKTISHNIGELLGWSDRFFIVRRSGWYDTYDEQGNKIKTISTNIGNFVSICADQFIVRRSAWLDTYDAWGKKISTRAAR